MCQPRKYSSPKAKTKCVAKYCRRARANGRFCHHHETENKKAKNPYRYWFNVNKANANRRARKAGNGKFWYVSFEYFVEICNLYGYLELKGRYKDDMTLDCIENEKGYVDGNLRVIKNTDNASKGTKAVTWNYTTGEWEIIHKNCVATCAPEDLPF